MNLKISDDVATLLINETQRLPADLQVGLKVASCMGSCVKYSVLDILSRDLNLDLQLVLQQLSMKGFLHNESAASSFRFVHDKIEQAAIELMSEQERRGFHMRLGLAICSHIPATDSENDEIFFAAVNQSKL
jgi:predicted ATPase